ncbi:ribosome biogenesis GTPase [Lishizhenia tianjinensis]|uniref:Small ribosomal subunit biogenesis GTPase RsgA n=1 Tax=Lishizhenia tianjinensis TaxID=477690 RepID=A0A1I7BRN3_9FLAO|nr:ribosome small subunit-dependent GTPase A [Lishizhenia tianjinensis]SFT89826.1 ribosome biogenesis GTPase [Lishizhenia tianjinensis]
MIGKVLKSTGKLYSVLHENTLYSCRIRGKIRLQGLKTTNPVAVGDEVDFEVTDQDLNQGVIKDVMPRHNYIVRKSINLSKQKHILASNVDRAYLLVTLVAPETHLAFIDRFLVSAESFRIPVTLLFNKMDMYFEEHLPLVDAMIEKYEKIGYTCQKISALKEENVQFLRDEIAGKQVMIAGHSGVGKSTLVNALDDNLDIKTNEISATHLQGQHTTTFAEMHPLKSGGFIIDTPGIRAFGIVELEKEHISHYFPEMRERLNHCKFNNCLHQNEPQCAVKEAVENGEIAESRYINYLSLITDDEDDHFRKSIFG